MNNNFSILFRIVNALNVLNFWYTVPDFHRFFSTQFKDTPGKAIFRIAGGNENQKIILRGLPDTSKFFVKLYTRNDTDRY